MPTTNLSADTPQNAPDPFQIMRDPSLEWVELRYQRQARRQSDWIRGFVFR